MKNLDEIYLGGTSFRELKEGYGLTFNDIQAYLPPLEKDEQLFWEYLNYALALAALIVIALWQGHRRLRRQQRYLQDLGGRA